MIVLSTDFLASPGSPTITGDGESAAGANAFLLHLLAQLHEVDAAAVASLAGPVSPALPDVASLAGPVSPALPDASLGEIPETGMETVTPQQVDEERQVLVQLLHMLHDLVTEVLGPFPQTPNTPTEPSENNNIELPLLQQDSGDERLTLQLPNARAESAAALAALEHGSVLELPVTVPAPHSLQRSETVSVSLPAPMGIVVESDEHTMFAESAPVSNEGGLAQLVPPGVTDQRSAERVEAVLPVAAQNADLESLDGETQANEPNVPGENDQRLTSRTGATATPQQPGYEGNTLGNAPGTPYVAGGAASIASTVVEELAAAGPFAIPDGVDDASISPIRTLTPLRSLSVPRNTVVLQVEPPELGTLVVQVRQVNEHFTASFWADSSEVRSLLQGHFPALNEALSQQGFQVEQLALNMHLGQSFAGHSGGFAQQHVLATAFSYGQLEEEHEPQDDARRRLAVAPSRAHGSGHVDITI